MDTRIFSSVAVLLGSVTLLRAGEPTTRGFRAVEIDAKIEIGYGVAVADVDGDKKPDILLADKKQIVWYRNPSWEKFVIAENLTKLDNVCIAAADIDGDGRAEVAVGAEWNPGDTVNSGAVFYLIPPKDRTQKWEPVELPHEPVVHRMRWVRNSSGKFDLVVAPLHGKGNKDGAGAGVRILSYKMPVNPHDTWTTALVNDAMHMTHNFDPVQWDITGGEEVLIAGKEGVFLFMHEKTRPLVSNSGDMIGHPAFVGAGEVRAGKLSNGSFFLATVEPMHGNQVVFYLGKNVNDPGPVWTRNVLDTSLKEGHALACGDLLGTGSDQIIAGWRAKDSEGKVGIKLFIPLDNAGKKWKQTIVDDNTMACEDLCLADLNGDGKLDIIASGRSTKNVKVYLNERAN